MVTKPIHKPDDDDDNDDDDDDDIIRHLYKVESFFLMLYVLKVLFNG